MIPAVTTAISQFGLKNRAGFTLPGKSNSFASVEATFIQVADLRVHALLRMPGVPGDRRPGLD